jgi:hypothetical protein
LPAARKEAGPVPTGPDSKQQASFKEHLALHGKWRSRSIRALHDLRGWLRAAGAGSPDTDARLRRALAAIEGDPLTVAVAGADRRGKTELINALFFADFGRRLLPVAGAGALCPLEIQWQLGESAACLRLLPIEYLSSTDSIDALKAMPEHWVRLPLHPQEPEQVSATLAELSRTRPLPRARAERLGLVGSSAIAGTDDCDVPCWRHAVLSIPHPLLKKGLVVLDLPGLDATARDPALHRELLGRADAVLITIAADHGVEADDLRLWQEHLRPASVGAPVTLVALTRIDLLGADEPRRTGILERLMRSSTNALSLGRADVRAVSAHDGLAAKIADKPARLRASGIDALESLLGERLTAARRDACRALIEDTVGELLRGAVTRLADRAEATATRIRELQALDGRSAQLITRTLERTHRDEQAYVHSVQVLQRAQQALRERAERSRRRLDATAFERLAGRARARLGTSWTTVGLRVTMRALFDELRCLVAQTGTDAATIARQVGAIYALMGREVGLAIEPPRPFSASRYRVEMDLLHAEAFRFIGSNELLLIEQGVAMDRFERRFVQRARILFEHLHADWDAWLSVALTPLVLAVDGRKASAERRLGAYQRLKTTREDARAERAMLLRTRAELAKQLTLLRNIRNSLEHEPRVTPGPGPVPYLVTSGGEPVRRSG